MSKKFAWLGLVALLVIMGCGDDKGTWLVKVKNQALEQEVFMRRYKMTREYAQHPVITTEIIRQFIDKNQLDNLLFQAEAYSMKLDKDSTIAAQLMQEKRRMLTRNGGPLFKAVVPATFPATEPELMAAYEMGKNEYKISHILVKSTVLADSISQALQNGASFAALVDKYTMDPNTKDTAGQMPNFLFWAQMAPSFSEALRYTSVGQYTKPLKTNYGYHVIRVDEVRERQQKPFEQARAEIEGSLRVQKQGAFIEEYINALPNKYKMKIDSLLVLKILPALQNPAPGSKVDMSSIDAQDLKKPLMTFDRGQWTVAETIEKYNNLTRGNSYQLRRYADVADFIYKVSVPDMMERDALERKLDQTDEFKKDYNYTSAQLLGQKSRERLVTRAVKVEESEVAAFYEAHKQEYNNRPYAELQSTIRGRLQSTRTQEKQQSVVKMLREKYKADWNEKLMQKTAEVLNADKTAAAAQKKNQPAQPPVALPQGAPVK